MKGATVFSALFVVVTYGSLRNEANAFRADFNDRSRTPCKHAIKRLVKNRRETVRDPVENVRETADTVQTVDTDPFKIPSLTDPSDSVGFLGPREIDLADRCFAKPACNSSAKFRTMDGGCNNLRFPVWGQARTANTRIIQADYSDGKNGIRKATSGNALPNVRRIRTAMFKDENRPTIKHNLFLMQYGQMVAHDTELLRPKSSDDGETLQCCSPDGSALDDLPIGCLPIKAPQNEPESKYRCFSIPRAADTSDIGCDIQPVRQLIDVSSLIDASLVYGSDDKTAASLRTFKNGKLKSQVRNDGQLYLPNVENATQSCNVDNDQAVCYVSGDIRVNQHPDIAVSTISLMRLHNNLCESLRKINHSWDDERLYQEARRLLVAMYQHVTYNEFLPRLVGRDFARVNGLLPLTKGFNNNYDQFLNPTTTTSFTSVAYRALHSYVQGYVNLVSEARKTTSTIRLSDFFLKSDIVQKCDNYDSFTRGMLTQSSQKQDQFFTEEISDFLFKTNNTHGLDLISLDMIRGRDYGEPPYNKFRQLCGLKEAKTFNDFTDQISKKNVDALAELYENVDDVDYFTAGILETPKPGSLIGHTFQCITGEMFFRWKFGDRFFYENGNQPGSFTLDQLKEIRKSTLALIVCMTSKIKYIQPNAFDRLNDNNQLMSCNQIPNLNLAAWKEV